MRGSAGKFFTKLSEISGQVVIFLYSRLQSSSGYSNVLPDYISTGIGQTFTDAQHIYRSASEAVYIVIHIFNKTAKLSYHLIFSVQFLLQDIGHCRIKPCGTVKQTTPHNPLLQKHRKLLQFQQVKYGITNENKANLTHLVIVWRLCLLVPKLWLVHCSCCQSLVSQSENQLKF